MVKYQTTNKWIIETEIEAIIIPITYNYWINPRTEEDSINYSAETKADSWE